ncbi:transcription antitermination factor NusB [Candidatus Saccharibacteria bacterium]|nr:transcription antitermination factor NusB [Candidatus Saccharibacteria bacterium]
MASNRHLGRIISLQSLYEYEFREKAGDTEADLNTIIAKNIEPYEKALGDTEFVYNLTNGVMEKVKSLDDDLKPLAPEWPISSIAAIDRNVLRIGLYELKYCGDKVPPKVAINEAVELAKAFGSENSSRFINGVLGTAFRQIDPEAATKDNNEESNQTKDAKESEAKPEVKPEAKPEAASKPIQET